MLIQLKQQGLSVAILDLPAIHRSSHFCSVMLTTLRHQTLQYIIMYRALISDICLSCIVLYCIAVVNVAMCRYKNVVILFQPNCTYIHTYVCMHTYLMEYVCTS